MFKKIKSAMDTVSTFLFGEINDDNTYCIPCKWIIQGKVYVEAPDVETAKAYVKLIKSIRSLKIVYALTQNRTLKDLSYVLAEDAVRNMLFRQSIILMYVQTVDLAVKMMSYEIVYAREFIKLSDGRIIPMILCGSNNCYETSDSGRDRRARNWSTFFYKANINPAFTVAELMQKVYSCIPSTYNQHFVRNGKYVDDNGFVRFFGNGIRNAETIEEICEEALWKPHLIGLIKGTDSSDKTKVILRKEFNSTYEIETFLSDFDRIVSINKSREQIYAEFEFLDNNPIRRDIRYKGPKMDEYYVIVYDRKYVVKLSGRTLRFSLEPSHAKHFKTEKEADKWIEQRELKKKFPYNNFQIIFVT